MPEKKIKKSMGRGLGALFGNDEGEAIESFYDVADEPVKNTAKDGSLTIKVRDIEPNPDQPRRMFDKDKLMELGESIKQHGLIQPLLVKPTGDGVYIIIAGERRWRAAKLAGVKELTCIIKEYSDKEVMEIALIENLQREDLNPIEEAEGYKKLMLSFGMRQEEVAKRVGKNRSTIANSLRLTNLCDEIKDMVIDGKLSQGHARALLSVSDKDIQLEVAKKVIEEDLSVRQTEAIVSALQTEKPQRQKTKNEKAMLKYYMDIEKQLSSQFGTKVKIHSGKNKSRIEIEYYTDDDLERLLFELKLKK